MAGPWQDYESAAPAEPAAGPRGPWQDYGPIKEGGQTAAPAGPWQDYAAPSPPPGPAGKIVVELPPLRKLGPAEHEAEQRKFDTQVGQEEQAARSSNLQAIDRELRVNKNPAAREILLKERARIALGEAKKTHGPAVPAPYRNPKPVNLPGPSAGLDFYERYVTPFAENALALGSGMVAAPVAGLSGMAALPVPGVSAADVVNRVQSGLTYAPRTRGGEQQSQRFGHLMEYPSRPAMAAGEALADAGYPNAAVVARTALDPWAWLAIYGGLPRGGPPLRPSAAPQVPWQGQGLSRPPAPRPPSPPGPMPPAPTPPGGVPRTEPSLGQYPEVTGPEFSPLGRDIAPLERRPEPALGGLPEPSKPEFPNADITQNVGGFEFDRIAPSKKPRLKGPPATEREVPGSVQVGDQPPIAVGEPALPTPPVQQVGALAPEQTPIAPAPDLGGLPPPPQGELPPVPPSPGHSARLDFTGQTVAKGPELPRPPYEPPIPEGELDFSGRSTARYDLTSPDDVAAGVHVVEDTSRRTGGTEEGRGYQHKQTIAFRTKIEEYLFKSATEGQKQDMWFNRLQDRVRNLEPEESGYADLADMTIPELQRAAKRYRDQVRTQVEAAARDYEGEQINVRARPYDRSVYEEPGAPPAPPAPEPGGLPLPPGGAAAAPEEAPAPAEAPALPLPPRPPAKLKAETRGGLDLTTDSLTTAISKLGGLSRDQMLDIVGDTKGSYKTKSGLSVFRKGGADIDTMLQRLYENHYISEENWLKDNGKSWLEEALHEEIGGTKKHYSLGGDEEARFARMRDDYYGGGPGSLSANPWFNPKRMLKAVREAVQSLTGMTDAGQIGAGAGGRGHGIAWQYDNLVESARMTGMEDMAAVKRNKANAGSAKQKRKDICTLSAIEDENIHLREIASQRLSQRWSQEELDLGDPPRTPEAMAVENEKIRRLLAREQLQRKLVSTGEAVNLNRAAHGDTVKQEGASFRELPMWATRLPGGNYLQIAEKSFPQVKQMLQARDPMAFEEQLGFWRGLEQTMQGSVNATMLNPAFHMFTVASRMAPFEFKSNPWWTPDSHQRAVQMLGNREQMQRMRADGYRQFPVRQTDLPTGAQMGAVEKLMRKHPMSEKTYAAWIGSHNWMAKSVNFWQAMFYDMTKADLMKKGAPEQAAHLMAIRKSNTMAGNLAKAEMRPGWWKGMGSTFFSRGYTSTVLRQLTRSIAHDKTLQAALRQRGFTPEQAMKLVHQNRDDFAAALMRDYIMFQTSMQAWNYTATALYDEEDKHGNTGGHFTWQNKGSEGIGDVIAPTRVFSGRDEEGNGIYLRAPFRTTLDMLLFLKQPAQILSGERPEWITHKVHPMVRGLQQQFSGEHFGGQPMGDRPATLANIVESTVPPLGDTAHAAAEAYRQQNADYLADYLTGVVKNIGEHPFVTAGNLIGAQVRVVDPHYEAKRGSTEVFQKRDVLQKRAGKIRQQWKHMDEEDRDAATASIREEARKLGIRPPMLGPPRAPGPTTKRAIENLRKGEDKEPERDPIPITQ